MTIAPDRTFRSAALIERKVVIIAAFLDALEHEDYEDLSFVYSFAPELAAQYEDHNGWWEAFYEQHYIVSIYYWPKYGLRCVLDREGKVRLYGPGGKPDHHYQIPGSGVFGEAATGLGYVNRIRVIGHHLYVCGMARQVYEFSFDGKNLASGQWRNVALNMRQAPLSEPPEPTGASKAEDEAAFKRWLDQSDRVDLIDIAGSSENDIYAVGEEAWHWNGKAWRELALPCDEKLYAIKIYAINEVYLVGSNGTLLMGSAATGFVDLSSKDDNQSFNGIEVFNGQLYLASNRGLFVYDASQQKILPCPTGLTPELQDTHVLEAKDGLLWSVGYKDIAYFDGTVWTRVDHPDNPPIR